MFRRVRALFIALGCALPLVWVGSVHAASAGGWSGYNASGNTGGVCVDGRCPPFTVCVGCGEATPTGPSAPGVSPTGPDSVPDPGGDGGPNSCQAWVEQPAGNWDIQSDFLQAHVQAGLYCPFFSSVTMNLVFWVNQNGAIGSVASGTANCIHDGTIDTLCSANAIFYYQPGWCETGEYSHWGTVTGTFTDFNNSPQTYAANGPPNSGAYSGPCWP